MSSFSRTICFFFKFLSLIKKIINKQKNMYGTIIFNIIFKWTCDHGLIQLKFLLKSVMEIIYLSLLLDQPLVQASAGFEISSMVPIFVQNNLSLQVNFIG